MNRAGAGLLASSDDFLDHQVALARGSGADSNGLIGSANVLGVGIGI